MKTSTMGFSALLAAALLITSCASSHNIETNAELLTIDSLQSKNSLQGAPLTDAAWPKKNWWLVLGNSQLNALIKEAFEHNPDIAIAQARVGEAAARAGMAASKRRPNIALDAGDSGAKLPTSIIPEPIGGQLNWLKNGRLGFNWDIDLWGGKRAAWEAAVGQARAAIVDAQATRLMVSTNVTRAYVQLGYSLERQRISDEELKRALKAQQLTKKRVDAGIDGRLQLKRTDVEVANAKQHLAIADNEVDSARIALSVILGQGPDRGLTIKSPSQINPIDLALPNDLPASLLGRRADLVAARWRVEAAGQNVKSAKAEFLPNISLGLMAGYAAFGSDALFKSRSSFYQIAPALTLPIFSGGQLRANLGEKSANYNLAVANYNKTLIAALNQVADVFHGLDSIQKQIEAQHQALSAAKAAWELSDKRYRAGVGSFLEALDVRQQLLEAEQASAALNAQQLSLTLQLIEALGGGFQQQADAPGNSADDNQPETKPLPENTN